MQHKILNNIRRVNNKLIQESLKWFSKTRSLLSSSYKSRTCKYSIKQFSIGSHPGMLHFPDSVFIIKRGVISLKQHVGRRFCLTVIFGKADWFIQVITFIIFIISVISQLLSNLDDCIVWFHPFN